MSTRLKEAQDKCRELSLKALAIAEAQGMPASQQKGALDRLEPDIKKWTDEVRALEFVAEQVRKFDDVTSGIPTSGGSGYKSIGNAPSLDLSEQQLHEMWAATKAGQRSRVELKAATDITGTAPTLLPGILARAHEPVRLLDHVPSTSMPGPSIEFLIHQSTVGGAGMVARGAQKPEAQLSILPTILVARKIAVWASCPDEVLQDFNAFAGYLATELHRIIIETENAQVLSGDGTGENLSGLLTNTGVITRAQATDTPLDCLEQAVNDLRVGPAYVDPDSIVMHPSDWSMIRRAKNSLGNYLTGDPVNGPSNTLWGTPVLATTSMPVGTALVANLQQAAQVFVRAGVTLETSNAQGFTTNETQFRSEERLALGVQRPAALVRVTGLAAA